MIEMKNISKKVGNKTILDDISLKIDEGSFVVLIGPSGCGKTTSLKLMNKLIEPSSGEIYIDGNPISKEDPIKLRRNIGYVIQSIGLFPHLTIRENIELIPKLKKEKTPENEPILKGTNVGRYRLLLEDLSYIKFEPQDFQQVAREELYRSPEKLFYRFINLDLYFAYDNHGLLSLNSANLVIPRIPDLSIKYILCILNSCVARFIYRKKFHSAKVLRNHIESIPIKELPWDEQQYFIKTADKLISGTLSPKEEQKLLREVDYKVGRLYGLTSKEVETVLHALGDTGES